MPLIKRIINLRTCKAITLPAEWLRWIKERYGEIEFVELEINEELKIKPHVQKSGGLKDGPGGDSAYYNRI